MKIIEGIKVVLADPGHPVATQVIAKIKDYSSQQYDEADLTAVALVHFPIDIHIDNKGATVTLRMHATELEVNGLAVKAEEPEKFVSVICSANAQHRSSTQFHAHGSLCNFGGVHSGVWLRVDMLIMDEAQ